MLRRGKRARASVAAFFRQALTRTDVPPSAVITDHHQPYRKAVAATLPLARHMRTGDLAVAATPPTPLSAVLSPPVIDSEAHGGAPHPSHRPAVSGGLRGLARVTPGRGETAHGGAWVSTTASVRARDSTEHSSGSGHSRHAAEKKPHACDHSTWSDQSSCPVGPGHRAISQTQC